MMLPAATRQARAAALTATVRRGKEPQEPGRKTQGDMWVALSPSPRSLAAVAPGAAAPARLAAPRLAVRLS